MPTVDADSTNTFSNDGPELMVNVSEEAPSIQLQSEPLLQHEESTSLNSEPHPAIAGTFDTLSSPILPIPSAPPTAIKRFSSTNISKKFLQKTSVVSPHSASTPVTPAASAHTGRKSPLQSNTTAVRAPTLTTTTNQSKLVSAKLTSLGNHKPNGLNTAPAAGGWIGHRTPATTSSSGNLTPNTTLGPSTVQILTSSSGLISPANQVVTQGTSDGITGTSSEELRQHSSSPARSGAAWAAVPKERMRLSTPHTDFPTAAEAAQGRSSKTHALGPTGADKPTESLSSASRESADAFRGVHLDPNVHHWDEMEDDDSNDFLGGVLEFGDGTQYSVPVRPEEEPLLQLTPEDVAPAGVTSSQSQDQGAGSPLNNQTTSPHERDSPSNNPQSNRLSVSSGFSPSVSSHQELLKSPSVQQSDLSDHHHPPQPPSSVRSTSHADRGQGRNFYPPDRERRPQGERVLFNEHSNRLEPYSGGRYHPSNSSTWKRDWREDNREVDKRQPSFNRDPPPHSSFHDPADRPSSSSNRSHTWGLDDRNNRPLSYPTSAMSRKPRERLGESRDHLHPQTYKGPPASELSASSIKNDGSVQGASPAKHLVSPTQDLATAVDVPPIASLSQFSDYQEATMHSAAERARLRRMQEEREREEQRERARQRAVELEAKIEEAKKERERQEGQKTSEDTLPPKPLGMVDQRNNHTLVPPGPIHSSESALRLSPRPKQQLLLDPHDNPRQSFNLQQGSRTSSPSTLQEPSSALNNLPNLGGTQRLSELPHPKPLPRATANNKHTYVAESPIPSPESTHSQGPRGVVIRTLEASTEPSQIVSLHAVPVEPLHTESSRSRSGSYTPDTTLDIASSHRRPEPEVWRRGQPLPKRSRSPPRAQRVESQHNPGPESITQAQTSLVPKSPLLTSRPERLLSEPRASSPTPEPAQSREGLPISHNSTPHPMRPRRDPLSSLSDTMSRIKATLMQGQEVSDIVFKEKVIAVELAASRASELLSETAPRLFSVSRPSPPESPRPKDDHSPVKLPKLGTIVVEPVPPRQLRLANVPYMHRWDILTWNPRVPFMSRTTLSREETLFFVGKGVTPIPRVALPRSGVPGFGSTSRKGHEVKSSRPRQLWPTQDRKVLMEGSWRRASQPHVEEPESNGKHERTVQIDPVTQSFDPFPGDTLMPEVRLPVTANGGSDPQILPRVSLSPAGSKTKRLVESDVAFYRPLLAEVDASSVMKFTVSSELTDRAKSGDEAGALVVNQGDEDARVLVNAGGEPSKSDDGREVAEHSSAETSLDSKCSESPSIQTSTSLLLTPPTASHPTWTKTPPTVSFSITPGKNNGPDREHLKAVWSQAPPSKRPIENSLQGIADDFPGGIPLSVQDMKSEDGDMKPDVDPGRTTSLTRSGETPPATLSRGSLRDAHRGFQQVPSSNRPANVVPAYAIPDVTNAAPHPVHPVYGHVGFQAHPIGPHSASQGNYVYQRPFTPNPGMMWPPGPGYTPSHHIRLSPGSPAQVGGSAWLPPPQAGPSPVMAHMNSPVPFAYGRGPSNERMAMFPSGLPYGHSPQAGTLTATHVALHGSNGNPVSLPPLATPQMGSPHLYPSGVNGQGLAVGGGRSGLMNGNTPSMFAGRAPPRW